LTAVQVVQYGYWPRQAEAQTEAVQVVQGTSQQPGLSQLDEQ